MSTQCPTCPELPPVSRGDRGLDRGLEDARGPTIFRHLRRVVGG